MSSTEEALEAIDELINSDVRVGLPGLELEPIVEHFVDETYGSQLYEIKAEEESKKMRAKWYNSSLL